MNKKDFIDILYKKRSTFIDPDQAEMLANLLDTVSSDIYSESQRFIFELIQNADDAALTDRNEIHFDFYSHSLIVSHQGKVFDEADIYGITNAGKGTKGSDATKTGYKGIGFKSVFGKSNRVTILSDGYSFRFDRTLIRQSFDGIKMPWQIIPIWTDAKDFHNSINGNSINDTFNVSTIIELENSLSLKNELNELLSNGKILLFLRKITKISISINGKLNYTIEKQIHKIEKSYNEVKLLKNDKELSSWIVTTFDKIPIDDETQIALKQDDKTPDKLKEAKFTEISFAAKTENGKLKEIKGEESLIFTYLPTKVLDFEFPFLVNGSFLTNASREGIHEDRVWNQWLFQLIGEKIFVWFELLSQSKFKYQILHLLPNKFNSIYNELKISFDESFDLYRKSKCFIPNRSSQLKKAPEILIDKTGLSEQDFIPTDAIIEYINRETEKIYSVSSFVHPKLELKHKLNSLGAYTFDLENLEEFFVDEIFKANHHPSQNYSLIQYFFERAIVNNELNEKLKNIPFIFSENSLIKKPRTICFPSIDETNEEIIDAEVINSNVFNEINKSFRIKQWLKSLGVKELSVITYIENEIIGNIETSISFDNYLQRTRLLFDEYYVGNLNEAHLLSLSYLKVLTTKNEFISAIDCFLSNYYTPEFQIESIIPDCNLVSDIYCQNENERNKWKIFFLEIGVKEKLGIQEIKYVKYTSPKIEDLKEVFKEKYLEGILIELKDKYGESERGYGSSSRVGGIKKIHFIEKCENDYNFSKKFWNNVFQSNIDPTKLFEKATLYKENMWNWTLNFSNYFQWFIKNIRSLPSTTEDVCFSDEIVVNFKDNLQIAGKYFPVIDIEFEIPDVWINVLEIKKKSFEIVDLLYILSRISDEYTNRKDISSVEKKRIGLIYNKIASSLSIATSSEKQNILEWGSNHKLLCDNGNFEDARELKWVKIEGFINTSEHLKLLFIPENCETNNNDFEKLLELFGVQIIDSFIADIKNKVTNATLKLQLQVILPFFTAILERKHYLDYSDEFIRLSKIIDNTEFYNASEIVLSFKNQDEIILGPSLHAYLAYSELSFKGHWTSPITLYALIPELLKLFNISDLNEELKVLLQLNESDIEGWLIEQGYDVSAIKQKPEYAVTFEKVKFYKDEKSIEQTSETIDIRDINELNELNKLLKSKNISVEQLIQLIYNLDADETDDRISISLKQHLDQKGKNEKNRVARELVYQRLVSEGFEFTEGMGENSVVNGVYKDNTEYPLVVKSYGNTSYKFNIRPNEWIQLSKPNAMFWVHRGNGRLEVLNLEGLLRANSEFHVQFETAAFSFDGLVKFAEVFRFVKNVHFQLDAPNFSIAKAFEEYKFDKREKGIIEKGNDNQELLH